MSDKNLTYEEAIIKEYPFRSIWMEENYATRHGNLILTSERLVFLHQMELSNKQIENLQKLSAEATISQMLDYSLTLHKKNFQIPLSMVKGVRVGLLSMLPFPRPCLRIKYIHTSKSKNELKEKTATFMFTLPLLKKLLNPELGLVLGWVWVLKKTISRRKSLTSRF